MSNPLPTPPSNDTPGGLIKSTDVSTLYNLLAGATTNSISIDGAITSSDVITANNGINVAGGTLTASGLITANDGIDVTAGAITAGGGLSVPSGQTATVNGTITVPNATAPTQPVALGQQPLLATAYFHAQEQEPSGVQGGSSVTGVNVRVLNTVLTNTITGASLASNQITLPAGSYYIRGSAPAYLSGGFKTSLYNVTSSSFSLIGTSESSSGEQSRSFFQGIVTISGSTVFQVETFTSASQSGNGLGTATVQGIVEIYSDIEIWQLG